uniref:Acyl-CoA_dh_N domain-containing protein n=1 Tax=Soboliphyme baturini TaxID=241478 RepID=A0A183I9R9_9BILA
LLFSHVITLTFCLNLSTSGGLALNNKEKARVYAELGFDWSLFLSTFVHNELVTMTIKMFGNDEQKQKYLPKLASGEMTGAFCLHESSCGQDIAGIQSRATPIQHDGKEYLMFNGLKSWVTNGALADVLIVFSKMRSIADDAVGEQY